VDITNFQRDNVRNQIITTNFGTHTLSEQKIVEGYFKKEYLSIIAIAFYVP
jgi:hypothetical protein